MKNLTEEINELITNQAATGVLTADVIKQMHEIAENSKKLEALNSELAEKCKRQENDISVFKIKIDELEGGIKELNKREEYLKQRENQALKNELEAKHQSQRVEDHINMFNLALRNTTIKTEMLGLQAGAEFGGIVNETITKTAE